MDKIKMKAVEILNDYGFKAEYDEKNNDINIESSLVDPVTINYEHNIDGRNLVLNFTSSNKSLAEQKEAFKEIVNAIAALERIKKLDSSLVR